MSKLSTLLKVRMVGSNIYNKKHIIVGSAKHANPFVIFSSKL